MTRAFNRRGILMGLASAFAAPAIVHAGNLMPVKAYARNIAKDLAQFDQANAYERMLAYALEFFKESRRFHEQFDHAAAGLQQYLEQQEPIQRRVKELRQ